MDYKGGQYMPDCQCKSNILNNFSLESTPAQGGQYVPDYPRMQRGCRRGFIIAAFR
jgi:hypothetical protein